MDRKEAAVFLGLPEDATDLQIKKGLDEKIAHFEHLSNNSPSAFLRRLNGQHLSKLMITKKEIMEALAQPLVVKPEKKVVKVDDKENKDASMLTMPVILPATLKGTFKKKAIKDEEPEPIAFLIRHTEHKNVHPFPLFEGKNYLGRKAHPVLKPFLVLEDDEFISRVHAVIYSEEGEPNIFYIEDSAVANNGSASKNGAFINGNKKRITGKVKLKEKDTIQIGETKLIFKMNTKQLDSIVNEVKDTDYMHTVMIRL